MSAKVEHRIASANRTELARVAGVHKSHASLVLSGKRVPSLIVAAAFARQLGVSLDEFNGYLERQVRQTVASALVN